MTQNNPFVHGLFYLDNKIISLGEQGCQLLSHIKMKKGDEQMIDGKKLKKLREKAGLTGEQLGNETGVSQSMIAHMEREFKIPNMEVLARIADRLGVTMDELRKKTEVDE